MCRSPRRLQPKGAPGMARRECRSPMDARCCELSRQRLHQTMLSFTSLCTQTWSQKRFNARRGSLKYCRGVLGLEAVAITGVPIFGVSDADALCPAPGRQNLPHPNVFARSEAEWFPRSGAHRRGPVTPAREPVLPI